MLNRNCVLQEKMSPMKMHFLSKASDPHAHSNAQTPTQTHTHEQRQLFQKEQKRQLEFSRKEMNVNRKI